MIKEENKDLAYWKANAEEDYMQVPISVLRYISELEKAVKNCSIPDVSRQSELLFAFIKAIKEEFADQNWDYLDFIADRVIGKQ